MLSFFYRHQKTCMIVAIASLVFSFVSVGIFQLVEGLGKRSQCGATVFATPEGVEIKETRFKALVNFCDVESTPFGGNPLDWNFLNKGLVSEWFLNRSFGQIVFEKLRLKEIYESKNAFEKKYRFYRREDAPFIASEEVWKSSASGFFSALNDFLNHNEPSSVEGFRLRVALFTEEKAFPPAFLQRMLQYRQEMYGLPVDQRLYSDPSSFSLFGYKTLSDWFGRDYIKTIAGVVCCGASKAEKNGFKISKKEAKLFMLAKAHESFKFCCEKLKFRGSFDEFFLAYLRKLDCSETVLIEIYRDIMLFEKLMQSMKGLSPFDFHPIKDFSMWAGESVDVELVHLPQELILSSIDDLASFEAYIDAVYPPCKNLLDLSDNRFSPNDVKKKEERLVGRSYEMDYVVLSLKELESGVTVQELRDWQRDPVNKSVLVHEFPFLSSGEIISLDKNTKKKVDSFSRRQLILGKPDLIKNMLKNKPVTRATIILSKGKDPILDGIKDGMKLDELLSLYTELEAYSQDDRLFYSFKVINRSEREEILSLSDARRRGILDTAAEKYHDRVTYVLSALKERYPEKSDEELILRRTASILERFSENETVVFADCHPIKSTKKIFRHETFFDSFENVVENGNKRSPVKISKEIGPFYYIVHSQSCYNLAFDSDKLSFISNILGDEISENCVREIYNGFEVSGGLKGISVF
ncbi:MAG: hypothetical protein RR302_02435 [Victivallaceae bacterium]